MWWRMQIHSTWNNIGVLTKICLNCQVPYQNLSPALTYHKDHQENILAALVCFLLYLLVSKGEVSSCQKIEKMTSYTMQVGFLREADSAFLHLNNY